jgi:hypothetical protein
VQGREDLAEAVSERFGLADDLGSITSLDGAKQPGRRWSTVGTSRRGISSNFAEQDTSLELDDAVCDAFARAVAVGALYAASCTAAVEVLAPEKSAQGLLDGATVATGEG